MSTKRSFNGFHWHPYNENLDNDLTFEIAQKNNISINLSKLLLNRNIKKVSHFLNSRLKENISISQIMKLNNINKTISFFDKVKK